MSWNPVLNFFIEVKTEFIKECGEEALWKYGREDSYTDCLSYWIQTLKDFKHPKCHYYSTVVESLLLNESMGLLLIKYNDLNIDWNIYNGFYRECRSVVIDVLNDALVLTPFRKFFNINELEETQLQIVQKKLEHAARIEITDKIDGSMCSACWYRGELIMSGSQALDVNKSYRLKNYYHWMYQNPNAMLMVKNYPDYTFIFEGVFPDDVHVVQYNEQMFGLHLLGMRRMMDGKELPYYRVVETAQEYDVPHVKIFDITFEEAYQDAVNNGRLANEGEGYVIDIDGQKYKLKYNDYVQIHRAIAKMVSPNAIIAAIHEGHWDDFYAKIPLAYQPQAKEIADNVFKYIQMFDHQVIYWWDEVSEFCNFNNDRKNFMLTVDKIVPKCYQGSVRGKYLMKEVDYLRGKRYNDILNYITDHQQKINMDNLQAEIINTNKLNAI